MALHSFKILVLHVPRIDIRDKKGVDMVIGNWCWIKQSSVLKPFFFYLYVILSPLCIFFLQHCFYKIHNKHVYAHQIYWNTHQYEWTNICNKFILWIAVSIFVFYPFRSATRSDCRLYPDTYLQWYWFLLPACTSLLVL